MAPEFLEQLLGALPVVPDPDGRLLLGPEGNEDAAIVRVPPNMALVQTVDILSPIGNDPYIFGQIAAANALSDVYAMGGEVWSALNIVSFPSSAQAAQEGLTMAVLAEILRGGASKLAEAGAVLAGGHTLEDDDPKYGLSVTGVISPDKFATNRGLRAGDQLILTKPLGTGILSTVAKAKWEDWEEAEKEFCSWAVRLNRGGARVIRELELLAATDITGFGLGGHSLEMARASQVCVRLVADQVPLMDKVLEYAMDGMIPAGSHANRNYCSRQVKVSSIVSAAMESIIFDAQTSGGLLLAVPMAKIEQARQLLRQYGEQAWLVGEVRDLAEDGVFLRIE